MKINSGLISILILLCLSLPQMGKSQVSEEEKPAKPVKVLFGFDSYNSFIANKRASIFGLRFGIEIREKWRVGTGLYFLTSDLQKTVILPDTNGNPLQSRVKLNLVYFGYFGEYIFFRNQRWEFSAPIYLGLGVAGLSRVNNPTVVLPFTKRTFPVLVPAVTGQYKFFPWIGLGLGTGYRLILGRQPIINESLNSWVYAIKVKIFLGPLWRAVTKGEWLFPPKEHHHKEEFKEEG
ncbi:MAG: hypothetical protein H6581_17260 [Bacteroidia bacterium]|nr:hypothetical protein [Bacteroidia bacterium]